MQSTESKAKQVYTPELDKMQAVHDQSQAIGEFLDWAVAKGRVEVTGSVEKLLAEYFKINLDRCEQERQMILKNLREERNK